MIKRPKTVNIEIYGRANCSACSEALQFVQKHNLPFVYHDVTKVAVLAELKERLRSEPKTVPQIFIGRRLIGGRDQLVAMPLMMIQQMVGGG